MNNKYYRLAEAIDFSKYLKSPATIVIGSMAAMTVLVASMVALAKWLGHLNPKVMESFRWYIAEEIDKESKKLVKQNIPIDSKHVTLIETLMMYRLGYNTFKSLFDRKEILFDIYANAGLLDRSKKGRQMNLLSSGLRQMMYEMESDWDEVMYELYPEDSSTLSFDQSEGYGSSNKSTNFQIRLPQQVNFDLVSIRATIPKIRNIADRNGSILASNIIRGLPEYLQSNNS